MTWLLREPYPLAGGPSESPSAAYKMRLLHKIFA